MPLALAITLPGDEAGKAITDFQKVLFLIELIICPVPDGEQGLLRQIFGIRASVAAREIKDQGFPGMGPGLRRNGAAVGYGSPSNLTWKPIQA
jgi:hypothetical protein